jgi:ParB family transcriptional regulator, chromosome partitioning protein
MPVTTRSLLAPQRMALPVQRLKPNPFSISIYGDPSAEIDDLLPSIREHGVLVALVVAAGPLAGTWEVISGHRRLACAQALGLAKIPCEVHHMPDGTERRRSILEYNRQRRKTFSQLMREADAIEKLWKPQASARRVSNLRRGQTAPENRSDQSDRRNSDTRTEFHDSPIRTTCENSPSSQNRGRTDATIAQLLEIGGKDLYRQARTIWRLAQTSDLRAQNAVAQLDAKTKTIHAAYKDLRRRDRFSADFRPTPYDVWAFRHDRAFGIPHPGAIPPAIVAHTLHYFTPPGGVVVDPMAGGGTTIDVCQSMGRRCLAYDIHPTRPDIQCHDICHGFPPEALNCHLIFCDPPYHTMLAQKYGHDSIASIPLAQWISFLHQLARYAFKTLRPGGYLALLLAAQTEKDLPAGFGYLDHAFYGYIATLRVGFLPERRISCPMDGAYLPQQIRQAREQGRLLGQVRDLLVVRKPLQARNESSDPLLLMPDFFEAVEQVENRT